MSITAQYQKSMDEAARGALRSLVIARPTTSIADLRELVDEHPSLGGVTLTELLGGSDASAAPARRGRSAKATAKPATASTKSSATPKSASNKRAGGHKQWNTRTQEGREDLDRAVLEALSAFGGVSASRRDGGPDPNVTESLHRIGRGLVFRESSRNTLYARGLKNRGVHAVMRADAALRRRLLSSVEIAKR